MAEINTHKEICNTVLEELVTSQSSKMVSREKYDMIFNHLKNPSDKVLAKFRFWVKEKGFYLIDLPAGGLKDVVVLPNKATEIGSPSYVRVIPSDMVYEFVYQCHVKELNHAGARNTTNVLKRSCYGIPFSYVNHFVKHCATCQLQQPQRTKPQLKPIIENSFLNRFQLDLVDMRHAPDGDYNYICHTMDHFTKFHVIYPLKTKTADEVAATFRDRVLGYFGAPKRFHSDNGKEFVNKVLHGLLDKWNPDVTLINGRPRHSQSQGLVERGNREIEKKLTNMKNEAGIAGDNYPWASWLAECMFNMNMQTSTTTNDTPYHLVFGVAPPSNEGVLGSRILYEEKMDANFPLFF